MGSAGDLFRDRLARLLGLEHDQVAGAAQDLAHQPGGARIGQLDDHRPGMGLTLKTHGVENFEIT